ncbi:flagellar biosynthetic protein FliR [Termitidicoccus mucosus]|uniref:flagellar biosynthetic protein FliR n=1 Tax=Termitidicoccus mucosus TaxID=1184151 RepID=UPI0031842D47
MSFDWIVLWLMTGLRATGIVMLLPAPGGRSLPPTLRVACSMMIATLVAGPLAGTATPRLESWGQLVTAVVAELLLGFALGFVGRTIITGAEVGGRMMANELGLMAAPGFDVPTPSQERQPAVVDARIGGPAVTGKNCRETGHEASPRISLRMICGHIICY